MCAYSGQINQSSHIKDTWPKDTRRATRLLRQPSRQKRPNAAEVSNYMGFRTRTILLFYKRSRSMYYTGLPTSNAVRMLQ